MAISAVSCWLGSGGLMIFSTVPGSVVLGFSFDSVESLMEVTSEYRRVIRRNLRRVMRQLGVFGIWFCAAGARLKRSARLTISLIPGKTTLTHSESGSKDNSVPQEEHRTK